MKRWQSLVVTLQLLMVNYANCSASAVLPFPQFEELTDSTDDAEWQQALDALDLQSTLADFAVHARHELEMLKRTEEAIINSNVRVKPGSTSHAQYLDGLSTAEIQLANQMGNLMLKISSHILHSKCRPNQIPDKVCANYLAKLGLEAEPDLAKDCEIVEQITGEKSHSNSYRRLMKAAYKDGIFKINSDLPLPRLISSQFYESAMASLNTIPSENSSISSEGRLDSNRNILFVQFSQFLEQNLVKTIPQTMVESGHPIECCNKYFHVAQPRHRHWTCSPIQIPPEDPVYKPLFVNCLNYVRSSVAPRSNCKLGPPDQINAASDTFDLSQLYGRKNGDKMRHFQGGKLKSLANFLPRTTENCLIGNGSCLLSGDDRVNANPFVAMWHLIFLRSHNNIVEKLKAVNPNWSDQMLFESAQAINQALYQKIVYEEWLPLVVGPKLAGNIAHNHHRTTRKRGVSNEFATVGGRFYNSMMPGDIKNYSSSMQKLFDLNDTFYKPREKTDFLELLTTSLKQKAMAMDSSYVDDLTEDLYRAQNGNANEIFGTDSLALDIMRSRDHGLPGYVQYLSKCRGTSVKSWAELQPLIHKRDLELLQKVYGNVDSVDLIMGAFAEIPSDDGATVGPTLACIIGEQMDTSRRSDGNFYQKHEHLKRTVENYSGAKLLCETMGIASVSANIFQIPSPDGKNPVICCDELSNDLNLGLWKVTN